MKSLGLYIHIPFCTRKCLYCDFLSYPGMDDIFDKYIDAVIAELRLYENVLKDYTIDTVFIGGGTPSLFSPKQMSRMMRGLKDSCRLRAIEISAEANPETLNAEKCEAYVQSGINRLSIGLQSHDDEILKRIGRQHTFEQFINSLIAAKQFFDNINVDTIFSLPGQSLNSFIETVRRVIELTVQHVSAYSLKIEPGTALAKDFFGADEQADRKMYHGAVDMLKNAGYAHYETSNFAKENKECLHNTKYWTGADYLGIGVSAHSYITNKGKVRFSNTESLTDYLELINGGEKPVAQTWKLADSDEKLEYIMLHLRLKNGIVFRDYSMRFDTDFQKTFDEPIALTEKAGLIEVSKNGISPTLKGFDLQNTLITEFIKKI
ncbi:MAG: radical SAM family heme chaperone HemW [Christensenellales bacterium]|jgi:oxygen-independent coproporphyrinogen-3 oxidase